MDQASRPPPRRTWRSFLKRAGSDETVLNQASGHQRWAMGIFNDKKTIEVPGSVLLLAPDHNEPLGLRNAPARTSTSSIPTAVLPRPVFEAPEVVTKKTSDGKIILDPQPDDSANDPLNWPAWRRDSALLSLGLFCMVGGGMTPILAAGFTDVADEYGVPVHDVSLTTGLYMMGMGLGSVIFSPTAILWGKRPVYLFGSVLFAAASVWCALSPNFISLVLARIVQGIAVSPVECLPSATIAEIFFLHERAFRIGIYTLLLLGGKNLVPLISAAIIQSLGWRWVFWIVTFIVVFCALLLFFFVPETFWDRRPVPRKSRKPSRPGVFRRFSSRPDVPQVTHAQETSTPAPVPAPEPETEKPQSPASENRPKTARVGFVLEDDSEPAVAANATSGTDVAPNVATNVAANLTPNVAPNEKQQPADSETNRSSTPQEPQRPDHVFDRSRSYASETDNESLASSRASRRQAYTTVLREQPALSFVQQLKPYNGRLTKDKWYKVAVRPLILLSYPAVLWSSVVYSCSVGWLIVISESIAVIYREGHYNFNALQTGLVYISPFIGGILGTAVAGKVSDIIVKAMARRNGGLYEPEFRLVMGLPVVVTTVVGLIGFGWSARESQYWIVPTVFFGVVSFGCSLGSTTSITFCVDSYRQYAGEALVTLNFSKNVFHGLVFSLFVTGWLDADGPKTVYIWIGVIQLLLMVFTLPMYVYGKRARMWTVRKNFMERF